MVTRAWLKSAAHAQAVVTEVRSGGSGRQGWVTAYARWTDVSGVRRDLTFQANGFNDPPAGTAVDIAYDPAPGGRALRSIDVWHDVIAETIFAVIFAIFSAMVAYRARMLRHWFAPEKSSHNIGQSGDHENATADRKVM
jgi:hypothetical protein